MSENPSPDDKFLKGIAQQYLEQVQLVKPIQSGIITSLHGLAKKAHLWELSLILSVAEMEPVKPETIVTLLETLTSRSTLYRKINAYCNDGVLEKNDLGYLSLHPSFKSLSLLAKLHKDLSSAK